MWKFKATLSYRRFYLKRKKQNGWIEGRKNGRKERKEGKIEGRDKGKKRGREKKNEKSM